jgi:hypothetical protein
MDHHDVANSLIGHLLAEHRRLHVMLRLVRAAVLQRGGPDRDATTEDVVRLLVRIREELARHFAEEEAGGCLEEAACRCPSLSAQVRTIQGEHITLLAEVDRLIERAATCEKPDARHEFETDFAKLCERLHAHEAAENDVLRRGFGSNTNGDENASAM